MLKNAILEEVGFPKRGYTHGRIIMIVMNKYCDNENDDAATRWRWMMDDDNDDFDDDDYCDNEKCGH